MAQNNASLSELTALIEGIVAQTLSKSSGGQMATWASNNARTSLYLSYANGDRGAGGGAAQVLGQISGISSSILKFEQMELNRLIKSPTSNILARDNQITKLQKQVSGLNTFSNAVGGLAGVVGAYQSGDAISGAMSGYQLGLALGNPLIGAAIGLAAGLLSPGVDKWQRPKFKTAKEAFDKMFTMDRGERDQYYLPDSFYFRAGGNGTRNVVVKVGNHEFDDHIRESLTNNYASQLQRGLVF
jgi:hypothetical protein